MGNKTSGIELATNLFNKIIGTKPTRITLGHGSFLTFDFGRDIKEQIKTRAGGLKTICFGEWHLWVYMCAWRIDKNNKPFIGSNDARDLIKQHLRALEKKELKKVIILNEAFDANLVFGDEYQLHLFSFQVTDDEQWMLFTPEEKVFTAGPGNEWSYHDSDKPKPNIPAGNL
jgi:hypothetical protein